MSFFPKMYVATFKCLPSKKDFLLVNATGYNVKKSPVTIIAGAARTHFTSDDILPTASYFSDIELLPREEVVLGILTVILITLLTSVVYDVILRSRQNSLASHAALRLAASVEAVERCALPVTAALPCMGPTTRSSHDIAATRSRAPRTYNYGLVVVALAAAATFVTEVMFVIATQESFSYETGRSLGLEISSPVLAARGMGQFVRRNAASRPCVTPVLTCGSGKWMAGLQICLYSNLTDAPRRNVSYNGLVRFESTYHSRGCDHMLAAPGIGAVYVLQTRARLLLTRGDGDDEKGAQNVEEMQLLRRARDSDAHTARELQSLAPVYSWSRRMREKNETCPDVDRTLSYEHAVQRREVTVKHVVDGPLQEMANVYVTTFNVSTDDVYWWLSYGLGSASTSLGVQPTREAHYVWADGKKGMFDGVIFRRTVRRVTSLTLGIIVIAVLLVKVILGKILRPSDVHEVAWRLVLEAAGNGGGDGDRGFVKGAQLRVKRASVPNGTECRALFGVKSAEMKSSYEE